MVKTNTIFSYHLGLLESRVIDALDSGPEVKNLDKVNIVYKRINSELVHIL